MIIQLESARAEDLLAGRRELINWGYRWGEDVADAPLAEVRNISHELAIRMLIPSAALTARNPADRIRKRRRAKELIDDAQHLAAGQVGAWVVAQGRIAELCTLTPDQLLDLAGQDPAR